MTTANAGVRDRYSAVAIALHWLIAALTLTNIGLAWYFDDLTGLARVAPTQLHKSIGITVLLLSLLRLGWRLVSRPPPLPASFPSGGPSAQRSRSRSPAAART